VRSPYTKAPYKETTNQSLPDFLFARLRTGLHAWGDKPFIVSMEHLKKKKKKKKKRIVIRIISYFLFIEKIKI
jgi:hypothetical protein